MQSDRYAVAKKHVTAAFPMLHTCRKRNQAIKELESIDEFSRIFSPLSQIIFMKDRQMQQEVLTLTEFRKAFWQKEQEPAWGWGKCDGSGVGV